MEYLQDESMMREALKEAEKALRQGEIPVGAVIVQNGEIIARAHNLCEMERSATAHAELLAIQAASRALGRWRLSDCTLYVTLEPCPMCTGAAINARIGRIVYAAKDARAGACGSLVDLPTYSLESHPICESGLLQQESLSLLRSFFIKLRGKTEH